MNETDKLIEEQWNILPPSLQRAINAVPWKTLVQEIGRVNALDAEQIVSLEQETMFILYGFENPDDYVSNLTENVGVSEDTAYIVAESVIEKIFDPISKISERQATIVSSVPVPEVPPSNLPMVEKDEVAHTVPHVEQPEIKSEQTKAPLPDYRYEEGKDPYREPLK